MVGGSRSVFWHSLAPIFVLFEGRAAQVAPRRRNTLETMAIEVREGQAATTRQMAQGAAASLGTAAVLCVSAGGKIAA